MIYLIAAFVIAYLLTAGLAYAFNLHPTPFKFWKADNNPHDGDNL